MEVKLTLDATQLGTEVQSLFATLTLEQKQQLAMDILRAYMTQPIPLSREAKLDYARNTLHLGNTWDIDQVVGRTIYLHEVMFDKLAKGIVQSFNVALDEFLKHDPKARETVDAGLEAIKAEFPKYVHDAVVVAFTGTLGEIGASIRTAMCRTDLLKGQHETLVRQLGSSLQG